MVAMVTSKRVAQNPHGAGEHCKRWLLKVMNYPARLPFNCCCCYLAELLAGALSITQIPLFFVHNSPATVWLCLDNQLFMQICEPPSNTSVAMWLFDQHTMWRESVMRCLHTVEQPIPISFFCIKFLKIFDFATLVVVGWLGVQLHSC